MTELHRALVVVRPKRTLLPQIDFVEAEVVLHQQTLQNWINLQVVVVVDCVNIAGTVVNGAFQL